MDKFGAVRGSEFDSAVLQLSGRTDEMIKRLVIPIETMALPSDRLGLRTSPNNFLTHWSSHDGKQQIAVIYTKMASTFDGQPVVWTKVKSNGNLPNDEALKDILASLVAHGCHEISERHWGSPRTQTISGCHIFGGPVPIMHFHANNEPHIVNALLKMGAEHRKFGNHTMLSGVICLDNIQNPEQVLGMKVPPATHLKPQHIFIVPELDLEKPCFHVVSSDDEVSKSNVIPIRPQSIKVAEDKHLTAA